MNTSTFRLCDGLEKDTTTIMAAGLRSRWFIDRVVKWANALPAVILLSFVLALGFLLIILSCALWQNWLPLLVGPSPPSLQYPAMLV